jgi:hypothetical protein
MANSYTLTLNYKRMRKQLDDGEYPYSGNLDLARVGGTRVVTSQSFVGWTYKRIIVRLHELMKEHDITRVFFQRTEREDILPVELGERMLKLLRNDPLSAYRAMSYEPASQTMKNAPVAAGYDTLAEAFGEELYLQMTNGRVEDPETGEWLQLGYGPRFGWRIRRNDSKPAAWIRIEPVDDAPEGTGFAERVAYARWAKVSIHTLLEQKFERYYLSRAWNEDGPWISHDNLKRRLEQYLADREKAQCP